MEVLRVAAAADTTAKVAEGNRLQRAKAAGKAELEAADQAFQASEDRKPGSRTPAPLQLPAPLLGPQAQAAQWKPPAEMVAIDFTSAEEATRSLMQGPQRDWAKDRPRPSQVFDIVLTKEDVPSDA